MEKNSLSEFELLAPAGNYMAFVAAVNAGADACYMGLSKFNARVMTNNFTLDEYKKAIDYAHKRNVKVYLTLNTLLKDDEIKEAIQLLCKLYEVGLDAVIVQDVGLASIIQKVLPNLALHASTQMSICSLDQVKVLEKLGFKRVVLARELSIKEIELIVKNTSLEVEVFVHGALCVSVSGQCLMSALIGNRSANRGNCAGTCRKKYSLYLKDGKKIIESKYILSKKDIFGIEKIEELKKIGVKSFKIEGRNKTVEYVAGVVKNYRSAIDGNYSKERENKLLQLFNRSGKSLGYLDSVRYKNSVSYNSPKNTGLKLGKILGVKGKYIKVKLEESIAMHDGIEAVGESISSSIVTCIRDENFNIINKKVEKGNIVFLGDISNVKINDTLYKTTDSILNSSLEKYAKQNLRRLEYDVKVSIKKDEKVCAIIDNESIFVDYVPEKSKTSSINLDKVKDAFVKTYDTSVVLNVNLECDDNLFVPTSVLNELRKKTVEYIENKKIVRRKIPNLESRINDVLNVMGNNRVATKTNSLYVYRYSEFVDYIKYYEEKYNKKLDVLYITTQDFKHHFEDILKYVKFVDVYFVISNVTLANETKYIKENLEKILQAGIKGILLGNIGFLDYALKLKEKYNLKIGADYSLNVFNKYTANVLKELGLDYVTPLFEDESIDIDEISSVIDIELVQDLATVMTTRYCVISSFAKDSIDTNNCKMECTKNDYYLTDEQNKRYDIVTSNFDCISRYVRNKKRYPEDVCNKYSLRHCIL